MIKNIICIALFLLTLTMSFAQNKLNEYKYIVVPNKFEFQKNENQYNINALVKFLFNKNNYQTLMTNEPLPDDLIKNGCLSLKAEVIDESKMFKTQIKIQLKNCRDEIIYTSPLGFSREKQYKKAYHESIRMAFEYFKTLNYKYTPREENSLDTEQTVSSGSKDEIAKLKEEIKELKEEKEHKVKLKAEPIKKKEIKVKQQGENILVKGIENKPLTAELIPGSVFCYRLKDDKGQTQYTLLFYGKEDVYIVKDKEALVYKMNNKWVIAQYDEKDLKIDPINIKF